MRTREVHQALAKTVLEVQTKERPLTVHHDLRLHLLPRFFFLFRCATLIEHACRLVHVENALNKLRCGIDPLSIQKFPFRNLLLLLLNIVLDPIQHSLHRLFLKLVEQECVLIKMYLLLHCLFSDNKD